jgi:hypothetical protein
VITVRARSLLLAPVALAAVLLAGCATPPAPEPSAEAPYCHKTNKGRVIACTKVPAPSLNADADAKRLSPDPSGLTVYVVRRNWSDGRNFVKVQVDNGPTVETLPDTMVRAKLEPGSHTISFEFEGQRKTVSVQGQAGDVRFVRIEGVVWSWKSSYDWATEPESATRERATKARLIADLAVR